MMFLIYYGWFAVAVGILAVAHHDYTKWKKDPEAFKEWNRS